MIFLFNYINLNLLLTAYAIRNHNKHTKYYKLLKTKKKTAMKTEKTLNKKCNNYYYFNALD